MAIIAAFAVPHPPLIIPAVGRGQERGIQATIDACKEVGRRVAALAPDTLVISTPHSIMYRTTPLLHTSTFSPYSLPVSTSGATKWGVPTTPLMPSPTPNHSADPKSPSFSRPLESNRMLSGFTSRWATPRRWQWARASSSCLMTDAASASGKGRLRMRSRRVRG